MGDFNKYNDNELIYLIKSGSENAYIFLIDKYNYFIHRKILEMHLKDHEDCFQEAILVLYNAAKSFNDNYNKSFMKYYEQLLNHKLLDIRKSQRKDSDLMYTSLLEFDNFHFVREDSITLKKEITIDKSFLAKLTDAERNVFNDYYINNISIEDIAKKYNIDRTIIYHTIYRIKRKIKKYMVK